jgi:hypothetical protein
MWRLRLSNGPQLGNYGFAWGLYSKRYGPNPSGIAISSPSGIPIHTSRNSPTVLAFEGAGGACGEFDGVFGARFFGVLFEG